MADFEFDSSGVKAEEIEAEITNLESELSHLRWCLKNLRHRQITAFRDFMEEIERKHKP